MGVAIEQLSRRLRHPRGGLKSRKRTVWQRCPGTRTEASGVLLQRGPGATFNLVRGGSRRGRWLIRRSWGGAGSVARACAIEVAWPPPKGRGRSEG